MKGAQRLLTTMRPLLYVENEFPEKSPALIEALRDLGYEAWWHVAPCFNPANARGRKDDIFGGAAASTCSACQRRRPAQSMASRRSATPWTIRAKPPETHRRITTRKSPAQPGFFHFASRQNARQATALPCTASPLVNATHARTVALTSRQYIHSRLHSSGATT